MDMQKIDLHTNLTTSQAGKTDNKLVKQTSISTKPHSYWRYLIFIGLFILGSVSGFLIAKSRLNSSEVTSSTTNLPTSKTDIKVGQVFGSNDEKTFRDHAVGVLVKGGIDGEGSHHLVRPGGPSKNVYLTSSVVDLDMFEGDKVEVWGETFGAKKAGWLMDVGRVKVLELNATQPN